ncbi:MAG TPA: hypothetical protein VJ784_00955 [Pyrinomonadaceae bacterium]|nr:hypothetical protein [Pyrinomonadaceae bacterium]
MTTEEIEEIAGRLINALGDQSESILYYPHPFGVDGFVVIFRDDVTSIVDLIADAHLCVPTETPLYCLRRSELFELSLPVYSWVYLVNRHVHMAYWLKYEGQVLFGSDIRAQLELPNPHLMLASHIGVSTHYLRSGIILDGLQHKRYLELIETLKQQIKMLMATALLLHGQWNVTAETVADQFEHSFPDPELKQIWSEFRRLMPARRDDEHWSAFEAVWLFERFIKQLRRYAQ